MARIALIDDEARLLQTLARFLEQQGHVVIRGNSFQSIQEHLQPGQFEMLITDIVMPDFDGIKVLHEVVENRKCREPVVLITGEPNVQTASEAVRAGAFDYVTKPVTKDKLLEVVARGLRQVQLLRERDIAHGREMQLLRNLAALGESASVLSHEIRTPITSLRHALRAVGEKLGVEDRVLIEEFVSNLARIERLLSQTLSFAKPLELRLQAVAVDDLVRKAIREVGLLPDAAAMSFEVKSSQAIKATVDADLFGKVLVNLFRNAAEACNGRGHVEVQVVQHQSGVAIEVTDDGPGVPTHLREEIFRPFHSSKEYGTGIGLAFCRKVVESHGGSIVVGAKVGAGACFRIDLPNRAMVPAIAVTTRSEESHDD